jgi:hypothetical protein
MIPGLAVIAAALLWLARALNDRRRRAASVIDLDEHRRHRGLARIAGDR